MSTDLLCLLQPKVTLKEMRALCDFDFIFKKLLIYIYMSVLPACMFVQCLQRPEEVVGSPGTGVSLSVHAGN